MKIAEEKNVPSEYTIYFSEGEKGVYTISNSPDRPEDQVTLHIDQYRGKALSDLRFQDYGPFVGVSIIIALLLDFFVIKRIPKLRQWAG